MPLVALSIHHTKHKMSVYSSKSGVQVFTYMSLESLILSLLLLKNPELLQPLPGKSCLVQLALSLTVFPVLVQDLKEVLREELGRVKL